MKQKFVFIFKIAESITIEDFASTEKLSIGEPVNFAKRIALNNEHTTIMMFDASGQINKTSVSAATILEQYQFNGIDTDNLGLFLNQACKSTSINYNNIYQVDRDALVYINNKIDMSNVDMSIFLWQGITAIKKFDNDEYLAANLPKMLPAYEEFAKLQSIPSIEKQYFVQTDLRLPLFNLAQSFSCNAASIDTSKIRLISQAMLNHIPDIERIFEKHTRNDFKNWYGTDIYTEFMEHIYVPLQVIADRIYPNQYMPADTKPRKLYDSVFSSQGYATMLPETRRSYREVLCNDNVLKSISMMQTGRMNSEDNRKLRADIDKYIGSVGIQPPHPQWLKYSDLHKFIAKCETSIGLQCDVYNLFGLVPNRIVEALSVNTVPIMHSAEFGYQFHTFLNTELHEFNDILTSNSPKKLIQNIHKIISDDKLYSDIIKAGHNYLYRLSNEFNQTINKLI